MVDAYLSPILRRYVDQVAGRAAAAPGCCSCSPTAGWPTRARFRGKDAILSGPAGGIVGMARTAGAAGFDRVIGFDMGGTSTDVSHFAGEFERAFETEVAGVRMRAPMMSIHTVAAGGGSILRFDGSRFRVGPDSAGADPGPACYRRGGPLTVTDANVMLGRIQPGFFPRGVRRRAATSRWTPRLVAARFAALAGEIAAATGDRRSAASRSRPGSSRSPWRTWRTRSRRSRSSAATTSPGYVLACFGGAGGQHACAVADALGMTDGAHPPAGGRAVRLRHGPGRRDRDARGGGGGARWRAACCAGLDRVGAPDLEAAARAELARRVAPRRPGPARPAGPSCATQGTDTALPVPFGAAGEMTAAFEAAYRQRFSLPDARTSR